MEKMNEKIGIFILNYNGIQWLKKNIKNIYESSEHYNIIVIDNNSSDDSVDYINTNFPKIDVRVNRKNYGFAKGYNEVLLKEFNFTYFLLLNNDVQVTNNWIEPMLRLIKKNNISIVQPKILNAIQQNRFDYAGAAGGFIDILGIPFCRGRILNNIEFDFGQYDHNTKIFWASGCCLLIESNLFHQLHGFDEDLFMHQEEIDLCWRASLLNKATYYCGSSTIYHYGGGTLAYNNRKKHYYNHRNNLLMLIKNLPISLLIIILPIRLIMDYIIITSYFLVGLLYILFTFPLYFDKHYKPDNKYGIKNIKISFWILLAHISGIFLLRKFIKKRSPIKTKCIYPSSIIWDYYIMKIRKFSELKKF